MQSQSRTKRSPTGRPTSRPRRDEVRAAVLDAAARHFAAQGANASLRDIATDAGVNLGLIHRHFGNKDDLLQAVLDSSKMELLIYTLTWAVEMGLCFVLAISYLRG